MTTMAATHKIIMAHLLSKKVMQIAMLDSMATNAMFHKNIHNVTQYAITCGRDVEEIIFYMT